MGFLDDRGIIRGCWPKFMLGITAIPDRMSGTPLVKVYGPEGLLVAVDPSDLWNRVDRGLLQTEEQTNTMLPYSP